MLEEGVYIGGIYKHYKKEDYYKVISISYHHEDQSPIVNYYKCDENGIFKSIRYIKDEKEIIVKQPFARPLSEFIACIAGGYPNNPAIYRFTLFKQPTS